MSDHQTINAVISIINDFLNVGRFSFSCISPRLQVIAAFGAVISKLENAHGEIYNQNLKEELEYLEPKLDMLSDKMNRHFDILKDLMSDNVLYGELAQGASTLTKFMMDTISNPCGHSINIFRDVCCKMSPLSYGYKLISLVEQNSTNPIKVAMRSDVLKQTATFEKWRSTVDGVVSQFLFLETFNNGLTWGQNMYGPEQLKKNIEKLNRKIEYCQEEFKISYWPDVVKILVDRIQDQNRNYSHLDKARKLQDALGKILTDDVFYIIVYDDCVGFENHSFSSNENQAITCFQRSGCNIIVYRSRKWRELGVEEITKMQQEVEACREASNSWTTDVKDLPRWIMSNCVQNAGFIGLIKVENDVSVLAANSTSGRPAGPGAITNLVLRNCAQKYVMISGYK